MPYRKRIQVKKEDQIVEIEHFSEKIWNKVVEYKTALLIITTGILLFVIVFFSYEFISNQSEQKAAELEYEAFSEYSKKNQLSGPDHEKQIKKAIELFNKVLAAYPKTKSAAIAAFYLGNAWVDLKDYDKGIEFYNKAMTQYRADPVIQGLIELRLGYAYLDKNEKEKALEVFGRVEQNKQSPNDVFASYEIGQIYENEGKKAEALARYEAIVKAYSSSPLAVEASSRITSIKGPESSKKEISSPALSSPQTLAPGSAPSSNLK